MTQYHHPEYLCIIFCQISLHVSLVPPGVSICDSEFPFGVLEDIIFLSAKI
jgi:hypothetical protein